MESRVVRRTCLSLSTLAMLAGALGMAASFLFLASRSSDDVSAGSAGFVAGSVLAGCGLISLTILMTRTPRREATAFLRSCSRWAVVGAIMILPTALLLGPVDGFHHHIGFGVLFYMVWNGEDPTPGTFQIIEGYEVWLDPIRFAITVALWLWILVVVVVETRTIRSESKGKEALDR